MARLDLVQTIIDFKGFIRKLNLKVLIKDTSQHNKAKGDVVMPSVYNPPLHPTISVFEETCQEDIRRVLNNKSNNKFYYLTAPERQGLQQLAKNRNIRIMRADKRGALVIVNHMDYVKGMYSFLEDAVFYTKITKNYICKA